MMFLGGMLVGIVIGAAAMFAVLYWFVARST